MKKFKLGDYVAKTSGSQWSGYIVGEYSTELTPEGYAVESSTERGSVQIYPAKALELAERQSQRPSQLKPLTEEELNKIMTETWGSASIAPQSAPAFAIAIERAHGIGGEA
jgi:hypothetical protein